MAASTVLMQKHTSVVKHDCDAEAWKVLMLLETLRSDDTPAEIARKVLAVEARYAQASVAR